VFVRKYKLQDTRIDENNTLDAREREREREKRREEGERRRERGRKRE